MQYNQIGSSELKTSKICLGTMTWGEQNTEAEAHEQMDYAFANQINFFDVAEMYPIPPKAETQGRTESYVGTWLKSRKCRDKLILATKVTGPGRIGKHIRGDPRLNREHITRAVEDSLKRLQSDYIDLYQIHWPQRTTNYFGQLSYKHRESKEDDVAVIGETLEVVADLIKAGKIRYLGVSNETSWGISAYLRLSETKGLPRIVSVQNPYNLLNRSFEVNMAEFAHREKVDLLAYSPLAFGVLSGKYLNGQQPPKARVTIYKHYSRYSNESGVKATEAYVNLAREQGLDPSQMALAYINSQGFVGSNIIGATTLEQLKININSHSLELSRELIEKNK